MSYRTRSDVEDNLAHILATTPTHIERRTTSLHHTINTTLDSYNADYLINIAYLHCLDGRWIRQITLDWWRWDTADDEPCVERHLWPDDVPLAVALDDTPLTLDQVVAICGLDLREVA